MSVEEKKEIKVMREKMNEKTGKDKNRGQT